MPAAVWISLAPVAGCGIDLYMADHKEESVYAKDEQCENGKDHQGKEEPTPMLHEFPPQYRLFFGGIHIALPPFLDGIEEIHDGIE